MSTTIFSGFDIGPTQVTGANSHIIVKKGATVMIGGTLSGTIGTIMEDIVNPLLCHDNVFTIDGRVLGYQIGMYLTGSHDTVDIGEYGEVHALYGIVITGSGTHVTNAGTIDGEVSSPGSGFGIYSVNSDSLSIENSGLIISNTAVIFQGNKLSVTNDEGGRIIGATLGVQAAWSGDGAVKLVNHGYVSGGTYAFLSIGNDATIINDGRIKGQIIFGDGDDLLDNRGGALNILSVVGGSGDDTLIVDDAKYFLKELTSGGTDTVKSTVSYTLSDEVERLLLLGKGNINGTGTNGDNTIKGNGGNNVLAGLDGADNLYGGKGNDKLFGGSAMDIFHFSTGDGHDRVQDFHHMEDKIDLSGWAGMHTFNKVLANAHNQGANVLIDHGNDSLLLVGVHKGELTVDDFVF
jgi:Ca2+-binding RTX toxin-like protein